jgi:hypothetical protein
MLRAALGADELVTVMSDTAQGPGWWLASDGRWYPPELWTGPADSEPVAVGPSPNPTRSFAGPAPAHGPGSASPVFGNEAPNPYPSYGLAPYQGDGAVIAPKTNGLAIASLICSCTGLFFLPAIPGIVLGFVAHAQIKRSNGTQRGDGLAIAGIIVGFGWLVLLALGIALGARNTTSSGIISSMLAGP